MIPRDPNHCCRSFDGLLGSRRCLALVSSSTSEHCCSLRVSGLGTSDSSLTSNHLSMLLTLYPNKYSCSAHPNEVTSEGNGLSLHPLPTPHRAGSKDRSSVWSPCSQPPAVAGTPNRAASSSRSWLSASPRCSVYRAASEAALCAGQSSTAASRLK